MQKLYSNELISDGNKKKSKKIKISFISRYLLKNRYTNHNSVKILNKKLNEMHKDTSKMNGR